MRVSHWVVVAAFFVAYFTEDDFLTVHVWAGYTVGILLIARVAWGFVGPKHARFASFIYPPAEVFPLRESLLVAANALSLGARTGVKSANTACARSFTMRGKKASGSGRLP